MKLLVPRSRRERCAVCVALGLMVTSKKRQEFRIKLQKRARQRLEKRMETFREDYDLLQVGLR